MTVPVQSQISNPITGVFGTGQMQVYGPGQSGAWFVPNGIGKVRVRLWGGGGSADGVAGGGGGFAMKTIYDLSGVTSISVLVGSYGGTSSFGTYVSATGGAAGSGGKGVGGDINANGGITNGGGVGSLFGNGGSSGITGASGAGNSTNNANGLFGAGATSGTINFPASSGISTFSIDFIGTGGGAPVTSYAGINGGGGSGGGGFPGGGVSTAVPGAPGLVIVEW